MKVFTLGKLDNTDLRFNNNVKMQKENTITSDKKFNSVKIINPKGTNAIYIIENIEIKVYDDNKLKLCIGEEKCEEDGDKLKIHYNLLNELNDYIEIKNSYMVKTKVNEILNEQIIFILPNGCLILKVDKPVNKMKIKMRWKEEKIF